MMTAIVIAALVERRIKQCCFRTTKFMFTKEEVETVRKLWELLSDMEDWAYEDLINSIDEDFSNFFNCLDELLHFMKNNEE